ncbi:hypothetical protein Q5Y75_20910 [Ruegeria sp. 2205SS24-7]|uniref:hypothetical protein n=1 Tax=Ruegeria discodermiae TaxID=3064389 RepID=UPI0027403571|nr:hypothetical protein [Ruegeria sp. 2205SS24-7]MDP5219689.1 hypothetical protein [Ruegeria sp. 2205SS24-7]
MTKLWPVDPAETTELLQLEQEVEIAQRDRMQRWHAELAAMGRHARYRARHQAKRRHDQALRRAIAHNALPKWITEDQLTSICKRYVKAVQREFWTGELYEVHHEIALHGLCEQSGEHIVCGLHVPENLVVITRDENRRLGATVTEDCISSFDYDPFAPSEGDGDAKCPF